MRYSPHHARICRFDAHALQAADLPGQGSGGVLRRIQRDGEGEPELLSLPFVGEVPEHSEGGGVNL